MTGDGRTDDEGVTQMRMGSGRNSRARIGLIAAAALATAAVLTVGGLMASNGGSGSAAPIGPHAVDAAVLTPFVATEAPASPTATSGIATTPAVLIETATASPEPTVAATATATATAGPTPPPVVSSVSATPTVDGAWSATPYPTSSPAGTLTPAARALASSIEQQYGVVILTDGQDWGADEATQLRNITSIAAAMGGVPANVLADVNATSPLTLLSNHHGATAAGWEPYGDREANYFTNEDQTSAGRSPANEIVLQPGSNSQTIAHETMHAYQMRGIGAGQYALALLTPEMKSFMAATGWTQTGTDDQIREAASGGWAAVNGFFEYHGRLLTYDNEFGDSMSLYAPNPLEAYAEAGGLYYGHAAHLTLPDWPEYWSWFAANVG